MPTPPKPVLMLETEKKSHRTKAELEQRKREEAALVTGERLRERPEVKRNKAAHKEFVRLKKLLSSIEKDDALNEGVVNRYCILTAECLDFEEKREQFYRNIDKAEQAYEKKPDEIKFFEFMRLVASLESSVINIDKQIQAKRKMLLDIEKECLMTIAAALRSIPKKANESGEEEDPMARIMGRRSL